MIWLRLNRLEKKLAKRELSEHHAYRYLLFYLVLFITVATLPEITPYSTWSWDISRYILKLFITLGATYMVFRTNEKGDNRDFLKRYISLAFVIGIWVLLGVLLVRLLYKIILFVIPLDMFNLINNLISADLFQWLSSMAGIIIFYLLLLRSFKRIQKIAGQRRDEIKSKSRVN
ncbi:hypothetical protein FHG64_15760 [Antarcticibacterium flavum]|uniref:Uncharacterized protein n=1 Tax=Antarcticibacterium flavum TaxID=2058175 RepID=A0A5B7X5U3_9FLAO|nr:MULTISPECIES: hypothetical protein [Antarcticibacterium]MCM4159804.1 hypothetical protein [Antarcticibacterium sp. W02-3]QCY70729.1 hypothetical protein FHG64_15760 [Antarcticibacterium flavum]